MWYNAAMPTTSYAVTVVADPVTGSPSVVGSTVIEATSRATAKRLATKAIWDKRPPTVAGRMICHVVDLSNGNFALDGNPNKYLDREGAIGHMVDAAINSPDLEWVSCAVLMAIKGQRAPAEARQAVAELPQACHIRATPDMLATVYRRIRKNMAMFP